MLQEIDKHIATINHSIDWASKFGKGTFPVETFVKYRRRLKKIRAALDENCAAAAYGESQVGKSYLMSSLLSTASSLFEIEHDGQLYSFINDINPSGGENTKKESTGVITRFTVAKGQPSASGMVKVRLLSVVDIILLIVDSYHKDVIINPEKALKYDDIDTALAESIPLWIDKSGQQTVITEDDIEDILDYCREIIGNNAASIYQSRFCSIVAPAIQHITFDKWVDVFSLLWNKNTEISRLFSTLINEYQKLGFTSEVYVPFEAVLRSNGTLLKIEWLDTVCGINPDMGKDIPFTDVYDRQGKLLSHNFGKGNLSALTAELTFELPQTITAERPFLTQIDLLDFPGARSRDEFEESKIHAVLPEILRRGKVAYLFNKYSRTMKISSVLFCHHNDQKTVATIGKDISKWIENNIGRTPQEREAMLQHTAGIAPLFMVATKFNIDLERTRNDTPDHLDTLDNHWGRFKTIIPEIINPDHWLDEWVPEGRLFSSTAFQNIYPLRDFYWSAKNNLFDGYSDGATKSPETALHIDPDFPDYMDALRESFLHNDFVRKHFADPEQTWDNVATPNNDGSKAIIQSLNAIANVLDEARRKKYLAELRSIQQEMLHSLTPYFKPEDSAEKNKKVRQISSDIQFDLTYSVGAKPDIFGQIIDGLMVHVGDIRDIAYDIIICHSDTPKDFSAIHFIRAAAGINLQDSREENIRKLCLHFNCDEQQLTRHLGKHHCTIDEITSKSITTPTTIGDVVANHILDFWVAHLNSQALKLEPILPHAEEVVYMLTSLQNKLGIRKILTDKINQYCTIFNPNEQPNAIADFVALTLNNFVSNAGRNYIPDDAIGDISRKAQVCQLKIDTSANAWEISRKPQPLTETLNALDNAADIINQPNIDLSTLKKLPLWNNFFRWQNLVTIGLIYSSDISQCDPVANEQIKSIIDDCSSLYNQNS
ncbi:MAG: hypothetical protein IJU19_08800 [Bacteroidales bacterium]|nr:hypothetical protein [Bacteroidales bacterium]